MSGNRGCIFNSLLFLVIVFVPILGHIIATIMLLEDDHSAASTVLWLALIWLVPFLGCFLFLGYSMRDWNFRVLLYELAQKYRAGYQSWSVQRGALAVDHDFWLKRDVKTNLEIALLADGVAPEKLYPLDLKRAHDKIAAFKEHVVSYWGGGAESHVEH